MCHTAWSHPKSDMGEVNKLKKQLIALICLIIGTSTAAVFASAGPLTSMTHPSVLQNIAEDATADISAALPLVDAEGRLRAGRGGGRRLDRAFGRRLDRAFRRRGSFGLTEPLIRVAGASSAKRAAERAAGGRAVSVVKQGGKFVVTVVSGGSAKRCIVDAKSGQVLGCR